MSGNVAASSDDGFSLVEVLVAFVIVSIGLVSFYGALGMHYRHVSDSSLRQQTIGLAQSHLESIGSVLPNELGATSGAYSNGARWQVSVRSLPEGLPVNGSPVRPLSVVIETFDSSGRLLTRLKSVKLQPVLP